LKYIFETELREGKKNLKVSGTMGLGINLGDHGHKIMD